MSAKEAVIEMIKKLPDEATVADIMDELYVYQKIDKGLCELHAGNGIPHDVAMKELIRWAE